MIETLEKKVKQLLLEDNITQESLNSLTLEERVFLLTNVIFENKILEYYKEACKGRNLEFATEQELHDYVLSHEDIEHFHNAYRYYLKGIKTFEDFKIIDARLGTNMHSRYDAFQKFIKSNNSTEAFEYYLTKYAKFDSESDLRELIGLLILIDDDQYKIKFMNNCPFKLTNSLRYTILRNINSDEIVAKYLNKVSADSRSEFIAGFDSDELKEKYISITLRVKESVIASLKSDALKEKYLKKYWFFMSQKSRAEVIASFESKELQEKYYKRLNQKGKVYSLIYSDDEEHIVDITGVLKSSKLATSILYTYKHLSPRSIAYTIDLSLRQKNSLRFLKGMVLKYLEDAYYIYDIEELSPVIISVLNKLNMNDRIEFLKSKMQFNLVLSGIYRISPVEKQIEVILDGQYQEMLLDEKVKYSIEYERLVSDIANYYKVPSNRLIEILSIFNMNLLSKISNDNFLKALRLSDEAWEKYKQIFSVENTMFDDKAFNNVLNAFIQKAFLIEHPEITGIFHETLALASRGDKDGLIEIFNKITVPFCINVLVSSRENLENDSNSLNYIDTIFDGNTLNVELFIDDIISNNSNALSVFHMITNSYISYHKGEYARKEMVVQKEIVSNRLYIPNQAIKYIINNNSEEKLLEIIMGHLNYEYMYEYDEENDVDVAYKPILESKHDLEVLKNKELLIRLIRFKKNPSSVEDKPSKEEIKIFSNYLKNNVSFLVEYCNFNKYFVDYNIAVRDYDVNTSLMEIIGDTDSSLLEKGIFKSEKGFKMLLELINRYKMLGWGDRLSALSDKADMITDSFIVSSFIVYFDAIYEQVIKNKVDILLNRDGSLTMEEARAKAEQEVTLTSLIDATVAFAPNYRKYIYIFGKEDFKIILADVAPYSSHLSKGDKLSKETEIFTEMYKRKEVTVPPMDRDFQLSNGKKLNVVVGNVSNPINLDLGERTGACMRMGGFATTLFRFANTNENGFHIRFHNPDTGELVSRVTGFRNGNTVFLNQLRYSIDQEYPTSDVIEAVQLVANSLIEMSKDSEYPIDNVVINRGYAMGKTDISPIDFKVRDVTEGFEKVFNDYRKNNESLYHDVSVSDILLASSNPDNSLVPVKLGPNNVTRYKVQRDKVELLYGEELIERMCRIDAMNQLVNGVSFEDVVIRNHNDALYGYVGEDFYCIMLKNGIVLNYIMDSRQDNRETLLENKEFLDKIDEVKYFENEGNVVLSV